MKIIPHVFLALFLALVWVLGAIQPILGADAPQKARIAYASRSSSAMPLYLAQTKGLFKAEALDVVDTWVKGDAHLQSFGPEYLISIGLFIMMCGIASITRNVKFHMLFVLAALVYEISFFARYFHTLN